MVTTMPLDLEAEDSDLEEDRLRLHILEDLQEAERQGYSLVPSESVVMIEAEDSTFDHVDLTQWENVPEAGIQNEYDALSISTHETIELDDEENLEVVESFTAGKVTLKARQDDVDMTDEATIPEKPDTDVKEEPTDDVKKEDPAAVESKKEVSEEKHTGRSAEELKATTKKKSKPIPERPVKVTKIDAVEEKLSSAAEKAEDRVWLDPADLSFRVPFRNVNNSGRLVQISKKLSYFLRGHPLEYGLPCPEFNFLDLSVKWDDLMDLKEWEVLEVIRSSDTRRFQLQVGRPEKPEATWKGLPWKPVACRTFQGHNRALMEKANIAPMVKELFTLDPDFTPRSLCTLGSIANRKEADV